jgi:hypothetical protein
MKLKKISLVIGIILLIMALFFTYLAYSLSDGNFAVGAGGLGLATYKFLEKSKILEK